MENFRRLVSAIVNWMIRLGQLGLAGAMLIIVGNILLRIWWRPIPGSYELAGISGAILFSGGIAYCALERGHIAVDVLVEKLPSRGKQITEFFVTLVALIFSVILGRNTLIYAARTYSTGDRLGHLAIPRYPFVYMVGIGLLVWSLVLLLQIAELIFKRQEEDDR